MTVAGGDVTGATAAQPLAMVASGGALPTVAGGGVTGARAEQPLATVASGGATGVAAQRNRHTQLALVPAVAMRPDVCLPVCLYVRCLPSFTG
ncbi:hypothetical protein E2562_019605 [Oryza meyeriana var. granulata]|uniref:Uncharacterized protein n=1 Tax=Oryza meyeriana var. granulata TaxID=110450 RepID=A0A6G1C7Z7_9ORYZ|nr:hypothetical protein E2562_019605 [Oryza meyeriana var. granulata]